MCSARRARESRMMTRTGKDILLKIRLVSGSVCDHVGHAEQFLKLKI